MLHMDLGLEGFLGMTQHKIWFQIWTLESQELLYWQNISDIVGVHEVCWDHSGTDPECSFKLFYIKGNDNHQIGTGFIIHKGISHHQLREHSLLSDKTVIYTIKKIIIFYCYYSKYYNLLYFRQTLQTEACVRYYLHYITAGDEWV